MDTQVNIAVLGSTGSIGTQTLDIIGQFPDRFRASVLTARRNVELLAEQARKFLPGRVVIADPELYPRLKALLADTPVEVEAGADQIAAAASAPEVDTVVTAMVGYSGLIPTIEAIKAGKTIALANKETLVVAGEIIRPLLKEHGARMVPVDSEHSAIFQCLQGEDSREARKIILTASGGPFRTWPADRFDQITLEDTLRHPNWAMGAKVTVDSATMINKGFEMIEARWLFDCPADKIEVVVHPQSIVHSMVEFCDGSIKAQLGVPDMHLPIRYALGYPGRLPARADESPLQLSQYAQLTFEAPDPARFPLLTYAFDAIRAGGNMPCILNAANEVAVQALLDRRIRYADIAPLVARTLEHSEHIAQVDLPTLVESNARALATAREIARIMSRN